MSSDNENTVEKTSSGKGFSIFPDSGKLLNLDELLGGPPPTPATPLAAEAEPAKAMKAPGKKAKAQEVTQQVTSEQQEAAKEPVEKALEPEENVAPRPGSKKLLAEQEAGRATLARKYGMNQLLREQVAGSETIGVNISIEEQK